MGNIRTDMLKESIAEYTDMANSIKENTSDIVNSLLKETVANEYAKILAEGFDDEDDDNEVKDTETEVETEDETYSSEDDDDQTEDFDEEESDETEEFESEDEDDWTEEYSDLKVDGSDDTYDFSNADDETVVKVYKRLSGSDELAIKKVGDKLEIKDNNTGAEYLIDLEIDDDCEGEECSFEGTSEDNNNDINESRMIEIVLTEDANLGYTTKYQKQDAMTTPPMTEPGKNVNDWDAGVPKGKERPYGNKKAKTTPFTEEDEIDMPDGDIEISEENVPVKQINGKNGWGMNGNPVGDKFHKIDKTWNQNPKAKTPSTFGLQKEDYTNGDEEIDEATNVGGAVQQRTKTKSHIPSGRKNYGPGTKHEVSTTENGFVGDVTESMRRKHNKIMSENRKLKDTLNKLYSMMTEAQVTNASIGLMNKLMTENTVAQDEKKEIYKRFNEVKTLDEAKNLYKQINRELQKKEKMDINESKEFNVENSKKINENTIYASKDLMTSLDLMRKICN